MGRGHRGALGHQVPRRPRHRHRRRDRGRGQLRLRQDPERFPGFNTPDQTYNGLVFARDLGADGALGANLAYILKARVQLLRDLGSAVSPFNAFLIAQGLETLSLRMERHVANATRWRSGSRRSDDVESVAYAGLPSSPWYERGRKYGPKGTGAIVAFEIKGGIEAGKRFVDGLELHSHVANIGDVRSLVIHPASTTHSQLSAEQQAAAGVTPDWSACPWASRTSMTSSPIWRPVSGRPKALELPPRGGTACVEGGTPARSVSGSHNQSQSSLVGGASFVNLALGHECQQQPRLAGRQPSFRGGVPRVKTWPAGQLTAGKRVEEVT